MAKKKYTKAKDVEHIKFEKIGDKIEGTFVTLEKSGKFEDGYALHYMDADNEPCVTFVNNQAKGQFEHNAISKGTEFKLVYARDQENKDKTQTYRVYELFFVEGA